MKEVRLLVASEEQGGIASALKLLDDTLLISPSLDQALELRARLLLHLGRFKEVADMLQDHIPSVKMVNEDPVSVSSSSSSSSQNLSREGVKLLSSPDLPVWYPSFNCSPVSNLKKKVMAGLHKSCEKEGEWRYLVLGVACGHLGLLEDAVFLLQKGKRLASATFRQESLCGSDDSESVSQLLHGIKSLIRHRAGALAALNSGLYSEAIRLFSKIFNDHRTAPQAFLAECYMQRASAYCSAGRIADSIADCNRTLVLDCNCIQALETRASHFASICCWQDSLHDLEHVKLLYNFILRDSKLPGPLWKRCNVCYREIPGKLCALTVKIQEMRQRLASGDIGNVDYYALFRVRRGCSLWELEGAYVLLNQRHDPTRATGFIDRCELVDKHDVASMKVKAKMSAFLLYRLIQTGYTSIKGTIYED